MDGKSRLIYRRAEVLPGACRKGGSGLTDAMNHRPSPPFHLPLTPTTRRILQHPYQYRISPIRQLHIEYYQRNTSLPRRIHPISNALRVYKTSCLQPYQMCKSNRKQNTATLGNKE